MTRRPEKNEYASYYDPYVALVPDGDIVKILRKNLGTTLAFLRSIPPDRHDYRYASGKWTAKEVVGHVVDAEWVFTYRALTFARSTGAVLPSMDQNAFVAGASYSKRPFRSLIEEFEHLRTANTTLFESFEEEVLGRTGEASGRLFTVRALLYVIAGHEAHHMGVLRDRYLA